MHSLRPALLLVLLALLAGCSNAFVYDRLDWLAPWYVERYVDLTGAQRDALRDDLDRLLAWHRGTELPRYGALLERVEGDLDGPLSAATVAAWTAAAGDAWTRLKTRAVEPGLALGARLELAQMAAFDRALWQRQADYEREYLGRSDAEYRDDSRALLSEKLEDLLGPLSAAQDAELARAVGGLQRFDRVWLDDRRAWLARLSPLLERPPGWQDGLRDAVLNRDALRTPAYRRAFAHNRALLEAAVAAVLAQRDARQDERLRAWLGERRAELGALGRES